LFCGRVSLLRCLLFRLVKNFKTNHIIYNCVFSFRAFR
jgi:hypothetical protein